MYAIDLSLIKILGAHVSENPLMGFSRYKNFEKGPKFSVLSTDGEEVVAGNYGIGVEDKSLTLQLTPDERELSYDLSAIEGGYTLTVTTPGEMVNLTIKK